LNNFKGLGYGSNLPYEGTKKGAFLFFARTNKKVKKSEKKRRDTNKNSYRNSLKRKIMVMVEKSSPRKNPSIKQNDK
jgi:hypothetical protein